VKELTAEEIAAMTKQATAKKEEKKEDVAQEIEDKYKAPETKSNLTSADFEAKDFTDNAGIKATSGISGFFKSIFGWIAALFS
jgi:hypothetical protein